MGSGASKYLNLSQADISYLSLRATNNKPCGDINTVRKGAIRKVDRSLKLVGEESFVFQASNAKSSVDDERDIIDMGITPKPYESQIFDDNGNFHCNLCDYSCSQRAAFDRHLKFSAIHKENIVKNEIKLKEIGLTRLVVENVSSFHQFPKGTSEIAKRWIKAIRRTMLQLQVSNTERTLINFGPQSIADKDYFRYLAFII